MKQTQNLITFHSQSSPASLQRAEFSASFPANSHMQIVLVKSDKVIHVTWGRREERERTVKEISFSSEKWVSNF